MLRKITRLLGSCARFRSQAVSEQLANKEMPVCHCSAGEVQCLPGENCSQGTLFALLVLLSIMSETDVKT